MSKHEARGRWKSRRGFLLAAIGSAVGLGNIWRFPYTAYENGGGAFLLPYLIALCLVGIPLMLLEQGMGHRFRSALPMACAKINRKWEAVGWWAVIFPMFGILLYYNVIISWCFNYLGYSLTLAWGTDTGSFFMQEFLGVSSGPGELGGFRWAILAGTVLVWAIIWQIVSRGVGSGIEKISRLFMPILFVQMMVLVAWSVFLPGASEGIAAYLTPDPSRLLDSKVWSAAFGQIFFSLSLGMGIMVAYSSYLPERAKVGQNSLITAFANSGFEIFAGFAVFSTLGYMAFKSGLPVAKVASGGAGLAFVAYPKAISLLPFASKLFGVIFFSALIFAGITSAISIFESFVSSIIDKFGVARKKVVTVCCGLGCLGSLVFTTGAGVHWLEIVDYFLNNFGLLVVGFLEAVLIAWVFGADKLASHINKNSNLPFMGVWQFLIRFIVPALLLVLLLLEGLRMLKDPYGGYSWWALTSIGIGWIVLTASAAVIFAAKRRDQKLAA